jgi:hypothetical protein
MGKFVMAFIVAFIVFILIVFAVVWVGSILTESGDW